VKREKTSPFSEIALVLVRFDRIASVIVNAFYACACEWNGLDALAGA
jgi:hypothetical protein